MNSPLNPGQDCWRTSSPWPIVWISAFRYAALSVSNPGLRLSVLPSPGFLLPRDPFSLRCLRWKLLSRCNSESNNLRCPCDSFAQPESRAFIADLLNSVPVTIHHLRETTKPSEYEGALSGC
ncbi:hypothetical protein FKM82_027544 [Ascaphus truei]